MNYLAHLYLSPPGEDALLGSVLGDFVKGPLTNGDVAARYGPQAAWAIALHRKIDSYTDAHPVVMESRRRVTHQRRRFAGIMVDMFYDHFLARNWQEFHPVPLASFADDFYAMLSRRHAELPERLQRVAKSMIEFDWLGSYAHLESIDTALNRLSQRLRRGDALVGSAEELRQNYAEMENEFRRFLPDVAAFARRTERAGPSYWRVP
ncbi:MAG: DUF479 domain-containing protein [Betaproteobacteria bacterium]|nr:MAG: DUF479 domain-containing protein [Betaproteobacteria bacterium]